MSAFRRDLRPETSVWFVANGTAANLLAIASLTEPWQRVICHGHSHYNDDESTAPERLTALPHDGDQTMSAKLSRREIAEALADQRGDVHEPQPGVVTISNVTEFGTVYTPQESRRSASRPMRAGTACT